MVRQRVGLQQQVGRPHAARGEGRELLSLARVRSNRPPLEAPSKATQWVWVRGVGWGNLGGETQCDCLLLGVRSPSLRPRRGRSCVVEGGGGWETRQDCYLKTAGIQNAGTRLDLRLRWRGWGRRGPCEAWMLVGEGGGVVVNCFVLVHEHRAISNMRVPLLCSACTQATL